MANLEDEVRDLREKNSELAQEVQFWKVTAGQKEKEKLDLMKEINDLRLKLSRLRSGGAAQARKLDAALQSATEEALSHLVQASGAVARTIELAKQYMQERQELDASSPRWSNLGGTPSNDKVHRVPPLLLGGQSIQPVVSLSRTLVNRSVTRSPNQNSGVTHRALPMHMLQDVYIPLTRIDAADLLANNMNADEDMERDNSAEDLGLEDSSEQIADDSQNLGSLDDLDESHGLEAVIEEDIEPEDEPQTPPRLSRENPLEGPSWLLDVSEPQQAANRGNLEPDSTTPCEESRTTSPVADQSRDDPEPEVGPPSLSFTPTVRRRKRASEAARRSTHSPHDARHDRRHNNTGRVLKVMVAKMRLSDEEIGGSGDSSPPKRQALVASPRRSTPHVEPSPPSKEPEPSRPPRFDAPSPNGATDTCVIVSEAPDQSEVLDVTHARVSRRDSTLRQNATSRSHSRERSDSDDSSSVGDGETRTRRNRKCVSYKEKPLNRKLRR